VREKKGTRIGQGGLEKRLHCDLGTGTLKQQIRKRQMPGGKEKYRRAKKIKWSDGAPVFYRYCIKKLSFVQSTFLVPQKPNISFDS